MAIAFRGSAVDRTRRRRRIDTNTYFNSFFEAYWRRHTRLEGVALRLVVRGRGTVRLMRGLTDGTVRELGRIDFDDDEQTIDIEVPPLPALDHGQGNLFFEAVATSQPATIVSADWVALDVEPAPVRLVAGYCTFNRETFVLNNIKSLTDDPNLGRYVSRIVVVDQGTRKVTGHPGYSELTTGTMSRVAFLDQANFGGAGGFTRCILEAMDQYGATHVLLLDDDAIVEPESVFRAATFFALANEEFALGGAMLDMSRPTVMYEAGGLVRPRKMAVGRHGEDLSLESPRNVQSLAGLQYSHYNAWWFFACRLATVQRHGLPLPFFIRCDDLEFGCRLLRAGIRTLTLPGLSVWHLPFDVKRRGWADYYYHRNMLVATALHFSVSPLFLAATFLRVLLHRLLTLDYFKAWALCEGIDDYLAGPSVLKENPERIHKRVLEAHSTLSPEMRPKSLDPPAIAAASVPRSWVRQLFGLPVALLWQFFRASPRKDARPNGALNDRDEHWYVLRKNDVVAIDDHGSDSYAILRRDRRKFFGFLARGLYLAVRLLFSFSRIGHRWRRETRPMTQPQFWREYLGMNNATSQEAIATHSPAAPRPCDTSWFTRRAAA